MALSLLQGQGEEHGDDAAQRRCHAGKPVGAPPRQQGDGGDHQADFQQRFAEVEEFGLMFRQRHFA